MQFIRIASFPPERLCSSESVRVCRFQSELPCCTCFPTITKTILRELSFENLDCATSVPQMTKHDSQKIFKFCVFEAEKLSSPAVITNVRLCSQVPQFTCKPSSLNPPSSIVVLHNIMCFWHFTLSKQYIMSKTHTADITSLLTLKRTQLYRFVQTQKCTSSLKWLVLDTEVCTKQRVY